ncbi:hypothetical protein ACEWY4_001290 [Coilia grayii]|uniref:Uncharacterized protein n=1 Tax=Coilia grayii TaxID=363190 RepID=A0ABD1KSK5_9TELE
MNPAWSLSLSALLLGCVFGFPNSFNSTQNYTRIENELNTSATNATWSFLNRIESALNITILSLGSSVFAPPKSAYQLSNDQSTPPQVSGCLLPTCALQNLGNSLNSGDEIAGSSTSDPYGVGKK